MPCHLEIGPGAQRQHALLAWQYDAALAQVSCGARPQDALDLGVRRPRDSDARALHERRVVALDALQRALRNLLEPGVHDAADGQRIGCRREISQRVGRDLDAQQPGDERAPGTTRQPLQCGDGDPPAPRIRVSTHCTDEPEVGACRGAARVARVEFAEHCEARGCQ